LKTRQRKTLGLIVLAIVLAYAGYIVPSGYFAFFPGDALPVSRMVKVSGGGDVEKGSFLMTTILAREANFYTWVFARFDSTMSLKTRDEYLPRGMDMQEYNRYSQRLMDESKSSAIVVGLKAAGIAAKFTGKGVRVLEIMTDSPARDKLAEGDIIRSIDGMPTEVSEELTDHMSSIGVGKRVLLKVDRKGVNLDVVLVTAEHPTLKERAALRIRIETVEPGYYTPVRVEIDPGNISGPSAGLMFTLEIINQARNGEDLTRGNKIAGTGTMSSTGRVGPVGGAAQKVAAAEKAGAQYFLVPKENLAEAQKAAKKVRVVPVETVEEALVFLKNLAPTKSGALPFLDFFALHLYNQISV
jgi:Lon-like protease